LFTGITTSEGSIDLYTDRYGDPEGNAARVLHNLIDLLAVAQRAVLARN
jgi:hypothetical protein